MKIIKENKLTLLFTITYLAFSSFYIAAADKEIDVGVDEKLGEYLPLDTRFVTSEGDTVALGDLINKPVLLALVYYECPGICNPMLTDLAYRLPQVDLVPGEDYEVITLSFDHHETPKVAAKWKNNYLLTIENRFPEEHWTFLTGDSISIRKVTDAVGFYFKPDDEEFVHAGTVVTLAPDGKICRYLFGVNFNKFDIKMALLEAEAGKTNPTIAKMLQFCFSYDPEGRGYSLNVTRIAGAFMLIVVGIFMAVLLRKKKKMNKGEVVNG
jgi:protein SCO1/2